MFTFFTRCNFYVLRFLPTPLKYCFRRGWKLLPASADTPQQILFLGFILCKCAVIGLNKSNSSFSTVINDLEELDLGLQ